MLLFNSYIVCPLGTKSLKKLTRSQSTILAGQYSGVTNFRAACYRLNST